jgi:hypothetical protein
VTRSLIAARITPYFLCVCVCVFVCAGPVFSPESCCALAESAWVASISQSISDHLGRLGETRLIRHVSRPGIIIILSQNTTLLNSLTTTTDSGLSYSSFFFVCVCINEASIVLFFLFFQSYSLADDLSRPMTTRTCHFLEKAKHKCDTMRS